MNIRGLAVLAACAPAATLACSPCRAYVQAGIFDGSFPVKAAVMLLPVLVVVAIAACVHAFPARGRE